MSAQAPSFTDTDGDGIDDQIDSETETPFDDTGDFSDSALGGTTIGSIGPVYAGTMIVVADLTLPGGVSFFVETGPPCHEISQGIEAFLLDEGVADEGAEAIASDLDELCVANTWE